MVQGVGVVIDLQNTQHRVYNMLHRFVMLLNAFDVLMMMLRWAVVPTLLSDLILSPGKSLYILMAIS